MLPLPVTAATSAVLGLIFAVLTVQVVRARGAAGASLGDGSSGLIAPGQEPTVPLLVATRSHANFAEYVPLALILLGFVEWGGAARWFVCLLATALIAGRLLHPIGMGRKVPNPFRAAGAALTLLTIVVSCLSLLIGLLR